MEQIDINELAKRLGKTVNCIRGYLRIGLLVWHEKDDKTGVKILFWWPCVEARRHLMKTMRDNNKTNAEMAKAFKKAFGEKDKALKAFLINYGSVDEAIRHFEKVFTEKGLL